MQSVAGIFVGGQSRRMGGHPKGLLRAPDGGTIIERTVSVARKAGLPVVLVGDARPYQELGLEALGDATRGIGPLGGLIALLRRAPVAVAIACDMPFVTTELIAKLAASPSEAAVVAPWRHGMWQPLFARYDASRVLPVAEARAAEGASSLQGLLDALGAEALGLSSDEEEALRDWDTPDDALSSPRP
jgi:molybdopterin-guanine dinucleotide biosynthesis protein A